MSSVENWELMAKYIAKECTEDEKVDFESWLALSEKNSEIYNKTLVSWGKVDSFSPHPNPNAVWDKISMDLKKPTKVMRLNPWPNVLKIAAAVVVMLGVFYFMFDNRTTGLEQGQLAFEVLTNDGMQPKEIVLADGTHIWVNKGSTIRHPKKFGKKLRKVILEGEAFFDVARDESRPFRIEAGGSLVQVLGTSFNVNAKPSGKAVIVNVSSGKVSLSGKEGKEALILKRGDQGMLSTKSGELKKIQNADPNIWSWKTGRIVFNKSNLDYVVPVLEKHFDLDIKVKLPQSKIDGMVLTSTFDHQSLAKVVEVLEYTLGIHVIVKDDLLIFAE